MQRQFEIMDDIVQVAFIASKGEYDELFLEVQVDVEEGHTRTRCWQLVNGEVQQLSTYGIRDSDLVELSFELHEEMKNHTGGDLKKYTLKIDKEGKAGAPTSTATSHRIEVPKTSENTLAKRRAA